MNKIKMNKNQLKRLLKYYDMLNSNIVLINHFKKEHTDEDIESWKELIMIIHRNEWYLGDHDKEFLDTMEYYYQQFLEE